MSCWRILACSLVLIGVPASLVLAAAAGSPRVLLLEIRGPIGPAVSEYVERGIERAAAEEAAALILRLDTPGGLDTSMRAIIQAVLAAPIPVVSYVAPSGARAASAGTYILYASHVAAMAPATNLGAATPVPIGPGALPGGGQPRRPGSPDPAGQGGDAGDEADDGAGGPQAAMQRKIVNDAVAYIRSMAELRGRNADWAEKAVRDGASLSADRALAEDVVDVLAPDLEALLEALEGREVEVLGDIRVLHTAGVTVEVVLPDWRTRVLALITNPNVAYLLLLLGIYGILFELYSPGAIVPGLTGVISLVLALYALHMLPVSFAGAALLLIGIALMTVELFTPSFGAFGVAGAVGFVAGSVLLFDTDVEGLRVSIPLVMTFAAAFAALTLTTVVMFARQRRRPVVTGREEMIGSLARAAEDFAVTGAVTVHGERWTARTSSPVRAGESLQINGIDGLVLSVEPLESDLHAPQRET